LQLAYQLIADTQVYSAFMTGSLMIISLPHMSSERWWTCKQYRTISLLVASCHDEHEARSHRVS